MDSLVSKGALGLADDVAESLWYSVHWTEADQLTFGKLQKAFAAHPVP